ncbi:hypothetical protein C8T65DRAFT_646759 [Cerioporus squamosus]|nr:hypothetical protein C8T65DRAFT_646759 [Cerioporus squamosus]
MLLLPPAIPPTPLYLGHDAAAALPLPGGSPSRGPAGLSASSSHCLALPHTVLRTSDFPYTFPCTSRDSSLLAPDPRSLQVLLHAHTYRRVVQSHHLLVVSYLYSCLATTLAGREHRLVPFDTMSPTTPRTTAFPIVRYRRASICICIPPYSRASCPGQCGPQNNWSAASLCALGDQRLGQPRQATLRSAGNFVARPSLLEERQRDPVGPSRNWFSTATPAHRCLRLDDSPGDADSDRPCLAYGGRVQAVLITSSAESSERPCHASSESYWPRPARGALPQISEDPGALTRKCRSECPADSTVDRSRHGCVALRPPWVLGIDLTALCHDRKPHLAFRAISLFHTYALVSIVCEAVSVRQALTPT